jgi:hypothetical protein
VREKEKSRKEQERIQFPSGRRKIDWAYDFGDAGGPLGKRDGNGCWMGQEMSVVSHSHLADEIGEGANGSEDDSMEKGPTLEFWVI